jgi:hypothetical protein
MFRSRDHHQGAALFLAKITLLKTLTDRIPYINLVLWQHVILCRSCIAKSAPDCVSVCALVGVLIK